MAKDYISCAEAAKRLDVGAATVRRMVRRGDLSTRQLPGCRQRVSASDVERLKVDVTPAAWLVEPCRADVTPVRMLAPVS